jgi:hypothetical protein
LVPHGAGVSHLQAQASSPYVPLISLAIDRLTEHVV